VSFQYLVGPSGGAGYHFTAWRYQKRLWQPFIHQLHEWLANDWAPKEKELLIFGSSAGWSLRKDFLNRFDRVITVDPDQFAQWLFSRRFGAHEPVHRADHLPWTNQDPQALATFLAGYPHAAVLFSNLLGQIGLFPQERYRPSAESREAFLSALTNRNWASYHDLLSSNSGPKLRNLAQPVLPSTIVNTEALAEQVFPNAAVIDHETQWLHSELSTKLLHWPLSPRNHHLIACIHHKLAD
jgi:hypothetical protein